MQSPEMVVEIAGMTTLPPPNSHEYKEVSQTCNSFIQLTHPSVAIIGNDGVVAETRPDAKCAGPSRRVGSSVAKIHQNFRFCVLP